MGEMESITIKVRNQLTGEYVDVLVDGDYDGEWFTEMSKWMRVTPLGYVQLNPDFARKNSLPQYLHHIVRSSMPRNGRKTFFTFKNGNKLDCRSENIEAVTAQQSALSRKQRVSQKTVLDGEHYSKYRGVSRVGDMYYPHVQHTWFPSTRREEDAARTYDREAIKVWGDRAILNFPEEVEHGR